MGSIKALLQDLRAIKRFLDEWGHGQLGTKLDEINGITR